MSIIIRGTINKGLDIKEINVKVIEAIFIYGNLKCFNINTSIDSTLVIVLHL